MIWQRVVGWILVNFSLTMFVCAIIAIIFNKKINPKISVPSVVYRWISFFGLGLTNLYASIIHIRFPQFAANTIGYTKSPFHFEVGVADFIFALFALAAFNARYGYRMALAIISALVIWTDAYSHFYEIIYYKQYIMRNETTALFIDVCVPLILLLCVLNLRPK